MKRLRAFLNELRRRKVWLVAGIYLAASWILIQLVSVAEEPLSLPGWFDTGAFVILGIGFPIALILAWAQETQAALGDPDKTDKPIPAQSIAVLAFENMSPDPDNAFFADGISEELLNALASLEDLSVAARTSSFQYRDADRDIPAIGRALNVAYVLEGSVRRAGDEVRITAQLIKSDDGYHVWSETYQRQLSDIFRIQEEISRSIVSALEITLIGRRSGTRLVPQTTENMEAYDLYLKGLAEYAWLAGHRMEAAARYFKQATDLDPNYAQAWGKLAIVTSKLHGPGLDHGLPKEGYALVREFATRALGLKPDLGEAFIALGMIFSEHDWNWVAAESAHKRALELNARDPDAYHQFALFLWWTGRHKESIEMAERGVAIDP